MIYNELLMNENLSTHSTIPVCYVYLTVTLQYNGNIIIRWTTTSQTTLMKLVYVVNVQN